MKNVNPQRNINSDIFLRADCFESGKYYDFPLLPEHYIEQTHIPAWSNIHGYYERPGNTIEVVQAFVSPEVLVGLSRVIDEELAFDSTSSVILGFYHEGSLQMESEVRSAQEVAGAVNAFNASLFANAGSSFTPAGMSFVVLPEFQANPYFPQHESTATPKTSTGLKRSSKSGVSL